MKRLLYVLLAGLLTSGTAALAQERTLINNDWSFSLGYAGDMAKDFGHGTEYFTYLCKVASNGGNTGPAALGFDDSSWKKVSLPHDWVVDLPFSGEASHSHGYKCIGWKYPQNSVGWYRKHIFIPAEDEGKQVFIEFDGIFRDSQIFCNGIYLGGERSGYLSHSYEISDCLKYGQDNVITVRADASLEEGWFYEGAGIYRNVYLQKTGPVAFNPYTEEYLLASEDLDLALVSRKDVILDDEGREVSEPSHKWSLEDPYLYTVRTELYYDGVLSAVYKHRMGLRDIAFDAEKGFLLNGRSVKLKGCNLHQDMAGVGSGVPDELWRHRLGQLKEFGFNAIRCSHNPASPAFLDLCDELGILVIDETRPFGSGPEQLRQLEQMILRDKNHPCIILWSVGNEEWQVETNPVGSKMARKMVALAHKLDPSRPTTYGNCSGAPVQVADVVDVPGYNYIKQNHIDEDHERLPGRVAVGTEETSGSGTRGVYETDPGRGWMLSLNLNSAKDTTAFAIERGWKFYHQRPWAAGLFYWTGCDYRGESNPMVWPATGSQFGILDYCGYPKDEAYYLKSWWTAGPVVHVCGPVQGKVTVYSNCPTVELIADGRSLGKKSMPEDGHLTWDVPAGAKTFTAKGIAPGRAAGEASAARKSRLLVTDVWPKTRKETVLTASKLSLRPDGQDIVVIDVESPEEQLEVSVENAEFLGWGNGDPGFKEVERPLSGNSLVIKPFSGKAQLLIRSLHGINEGSNEGSGEGSGEGGGEATIKVGSQTLKLSY